MNKVVRYIVAIAMAGTLVMSVVFSVSQLPWPERPETFGGEALLKGNSNLRIDVVECSALRDPLEAEVRRRLEAGEACTSDDQCQVANFGCPFGCSSVVNRDAIPGIRLAVDRYSELSAACGTCAYQCLALSPGQAACEGNRCVYRAEDPISIRDLIDVIE